MQVAEWISLVEDHHGGTVQLQQRQETGNHLSDVRTIGDQVAETRLTIAGEPAAEHRGVLMHQHSGGVQVFQ